MSAPISDLTQLLHSMTPRLQPGGFVFGTAGDMSLLDMAQVIATMREPEGMSVVVPEAEAVRLGWPAAPVFAWITLMVHSDLQAVGLTAAFATALGRVGISCNVVAGHAHDHIFVPQAQANAAMAALLALQQAGSPPD